MELTHEQKLLQTVIQKAWEDNNFKEELMTNPVSAIEKATGYSLNLPEGKTIVVRDQTSEDKVYINIPAEPKMDNLELSEEQLELVSGGCYIVNPIDLTYPPIIPFGDPIQNPIIKPSTGPYAG